MDESEKGGLVWQAGVENIGEPCILGNDNLQDPVITGRIWAECPSEKLSSLVLRVLVFSIFNLYRLPEWEKVPENRKISRP